MVLQRWQSVYLFIAAVALLLSTFLPVLELSGEATFVPLSLCAFWGDAAGFIVANGAEASLVYFILTGISGLLALVTIFKYKNLKLQKMLCSVILLLIIVAYIVIALFYKFVIDGIFGQWTVESLLPAFALICTYLAKTRIVHDDKLIHAADRLR